MATKVKTTGILRVRKHADRSGPEPAPGQAWPTSGWSFIDADHATADPPDVTSVGSDKLNEWIREGFAEATGERGVSRPGGEPGNRFRADKAHNFVHYDEVTFHTLTGDVTYKVTHQPDKYATDGDDNTKVTDDLYDAGQTRVDHYYNLERKA